MARRAWLRRRDAGTRRTCSVCTGAFLLACAGLLDGRVVTTHWRSVLTGCASCTPRCGWRTTASTWTAASTGPR
ncbi:hypothetical protein WJ970_19545 [Achromobacter xylosoxidans]